MDEQHPSTKVFANNPTERIREAFNQMTSQPTSVYIAVAFFTDIEIVKRMLDKKCHVRLLVRLGFPTSPQKLEALLDVPGVEIRYVTSNRFHPKLYIFGQEGAFVGSANLTRMALESNQEIVVFIGSEDVRFEQLTEIFSDYWAQGSVLDDGVLKEYRKIYNRHHNAEWDDVANLGKRIENLDKAVTDKIGDVSIQTLNRSKAPRNKDVAFLDDYRKLYQEFITAFDEVSDVYRSTERRIFSDSELPFRLEIDAFLSDLRSSHADSDKWQSATLRHGEDRRQFIRHYIDEWQDNASSKPKDAGRIEQYQEIINCFGNRERLATISEDDLFAGLVRLHSVSGRTRYYGGAEKMKQKFFALNAHDDILQSLDYLLYGNDEVVTRMANLKYNPQYKIQAFGLANIQELIGFYSADSLPVVNGRTTKTLRFLGFDVKQLTEM